MPYNPHAMPSGRHGPSREEWPAVDERLVMPGSGIEILDGKVLSVPGADPPHAEHHARLVYLLAAHVAPGFVATVDMLTRTSPVSDFAPDASIYPEGPDAKTGGRRLEVMAFEVVSKQALAVPAKKAKELSRRGVERVFALVLSRQRALEWDRRVGRFRPMHPDEHIEAPCLAIPIGVRELVGTARADEAVLAALEARRPDLVARIEAKAEARGEARGEASGLREGVRRACRALAIEIPPDAALDALERDALAALLDAILAHRRWPGR